MLATDRNALICDMAETYHIFDMRSMPAGLIATLAAGLPDSSRIKRKIAGLPCATETLLMALAVDRLSLLVWMQTEDGKKNRNRPESLYLRFMQQHTEHKHSEPSGFETPEAFEAAKKEILSGGMDDGN